MQLYGRALDMLSFERGHVAGGRAGAPIADADAPSSVLAWRREPGWCISFRSREMSQGPIGMDHIEASIAPKSTTSKTFIQSQSFSHPT